MSAQPPRILCLGGGYVAIKLARALAPAIRRKRVDLTIVSRDNFHTYHGFAPEMLTGKIQPGQIVSPARRIFPPARFVNANIDSIDLAASKVRVSRFLDGRDYELPFDHLVLGLGSLEDLTRYAGLAEHAQKLKTYWDCCKTRNHIIGVLEMAELESDPVERRRLLTFVVAGGNFGGVEVATELQEYVSALMRREYSRLSPADLRIVLVHGTPRILPELLPRHEPLVDWAERFIAKSGIETRPNARVVAATGDEILLSGDERIPTRTIISCTGTAQSPLLDTLPFARDGRGRMETDEFLRVVGAANVWAGGDCASIPHPHGGTCPPLAIYALTAGRQIGRNILRSLEGRALEPYRFTGIGDACSLGRRKAIGHVRGIRLTGFPAWILWRLLLLHFVPTFDRKVRLVFDWLVWPLVGRDVVNMKVDEPLGLSHEHFEPGQEIVREGEVGQRLYLIWKGEVDVTRGGLSSDPIVTLGPGQHFGETAIFQNVRRTATVRARTRVELISLGRAEALALSATIGAFGDSVRRLPGE